MRLSFLFFFCTFFQHNTSMAVDFYTGEKYTDFSTNYGVKEYQLFSCNAQIELKFDNCRPGYYVIFL